MGTDKTLNTPAQQEEWINKQLGLYGTNSGRRWNKKSDGYKRSAIIRAEMKMSGIIKGGRKQILIRKEDIDLIEQQAIKSDQIPVLFGAFKGEEPEDQLCIMSWKYFFMLYKLAKKERKSD